MARVRLPILVTSSKLLAIDDGTIINGGVSNPYIGSPEDGSVLDVVEGAVLTFANRGGGSVTVYADETGSATLTGVELVTDGRGRFEGWIERSSIVVTASIENGAQEFTEHFDLAPAGDGTIDSDWIASSAVTTSKIANNAVTSDKINNGAVTTDKVSASAKDAAAGTASLRSLGTGATQAAAGNDSRLSNSRTPTGSAGGGLSGTYPNPSIGTAAVSNANVANDAAIAEGKLNLASDAAANVASRRTLGTGSTQAAAGNDSRFPTANEKAALVGPTGAAPSSTNRFVTQDSLTNQLTTDEKGALAGTSGSPSTSNRFVTNSDGRLPTSNEKGALAGALDTGSAPSASNPYVTDDDERFTYMIGDNDVTNDQLAGNITGDKLASSTVTTSKLASDVVQQLIPVGTILPYGGSTAPSGFVLCDGQWLNATTYASLFTVLGGSSNPYGDSGTSGSGYNAPSFRVPALSGRFPLSQGGGYNRGAKDGTAAVTLQASQIPAHSHTTPVFTSLNKTFVDRNNRNDFSSATTLREVNLEEQTNRSSSLYGGGGSHTNMPPYVVINYIIKF